VGYYFDSSAVIGLLRSWQKPIFIVRGNHDEMLLNASQNTDYLYRVTAKYGPGIKIAIEQLSCSDLDWISNLPDTLIIEQFGCSIFLCHGSPQDPNQYIYPDTSSSSILDPFQSLPDILVMGHTHYPMTRLEQSCLLVNPGSVGQPRNREQGAHWALLDTELMSVDHRVELYDVEPLKAQCYKLAPDYPYLSEVLDRS
jgi:putative phosphoesterase